MSLFDFFKKSNPDLTLPQTDKEIWYRDTYAIWSQGNFHAFQHFCGLTKNSDNASQCRFLLGRDWNTVGKNAVLELVDSLNGAQDDTNIIIEDIKTLKHTDPKTCENLKGMLAWDLCRATQVLGMAYHGGWIDRDMMNQKSAETAKVMQSVFTSWNDLIEYYLTGYASWAMESFDKEIADKNIRNREQAYNIVKYHINPAYSIDWNLKMD